MKKMLLVMFMVMSMAMFSACEDPEGYVRLPNLVGLADEAATQRLVDLGLSVSVTDVPGMPENDKTFAGYGNENIVGDLVPIGSIITILIYSDDSEVLGFRGLLISKVLEGTGQNKAIEIYNASETDVDLNEYHLALYLDGSLSVSRRVTMDGILAAQATWVIAHPESDPDLLSKADMTSSDLVFDGNDAIALRDLDDLPLDLFGEIGFAFYYLQNKTLIRKETIVTNTTTFSMSDWDVYAKDVHLMFGQHPYPFPETFTYNIEDTLVPYTDPYGMALVSFDYNYDGDTAKFYPGFNGSDSVRFVGIDTPEMGDPWSYEARDYLHVLLSTADEIYLQHDPSAGLTETYGRYLALVWADGLLTNVELVRMGYTTAAYYDSLERLVFAGVTLNQWFLLAEEEARAENRGIWG